MLLIAHWYLFKTKVLYIFFPFPKPRSLFIAASWQHFVKDGLLVLEYLKVASQNPDVSLTYKYKTQVSTFLAQFYWFYQNNWLLQEYTTQPEKPAD